MKPLQSDLILPLRVSAARYHSLDLWRGVACLMVIVYHSTMVCAGHVKNEGSLSGGINSIGTWCLDATHQMSAGVPMFFVISGYCIAASADNLRQRNHSVRSYFLRRFRRIYPPLWIVIFFTILFFLMTEYWLTPRLLSDPPWPQRRLGCFSIWNWLGNLTLTETWRHYFIGGPRAHFPGQAWTLCYEEQFYAVIGFLLLISPRKIFASAVLVTFLTGLVMILCRWFAIPTNGFFFDGSWMTFAAGLLVYYHLNYGLKTGNWLVFAVLGSAGVFSIWKPMVVPGGAVAFILAMVVIVLHRWDVSIASAKYLRPLMWCGQMCYSLYLVHQVLVKAVSAYLFQLGLRDAWSTLFVTTPVSVAVSIVAGRLFYNMCEKRFLNSPSQLS